MSTPPESPDPIMLGGIAVGSESSAPSDRPPAIRNVVVTDIQMPFGGMVVFMIKWALASIPAALILFVLALVASGVVGGLFR